MSLTILHPSLLPTHPAHWNLRLVIDSDGNYSIINTPHTHFFSTFAGSFSKDPDPSNGLTEDLNYLFDHFKRYVATNPTPSFFPPPPPAPTVEARLDNHEARITTLESKDSQPQPHTQSQTNEEATSTPSSPYKFHSLSDFDGGGLYNVPNDPFMPYDPDNKFSFEVGVSGRTVSLYFHSIPDAARSGICDYPEFRSTNGTRMVSYSNPEIGVVESTTIYLPGDKRNRDHDICTREYPTPEEAKKNADRIFFALSEYADHLRKKELNDLRAQVTSLTTQTKTSDNYVNTLTANHKAELGTLRSAYRTHLEEVYRKLFPSHNISGSWSNEDLTLRIKQRIDTLQRVLSQIKNIATF